MCDHLFVNESLKSRKLFLEIDIWARYFTKLYSQYFEGTTQSPVLVTALHSSTALQHPAVLCYQVQYAATAPVHVTFDTDKTFTGSSEDCDQI